MAKFATAALLGLALGLTACNQNLGQNNVETTTDSAIISGDLIKVRKEGGSRAVVGLEFEDDKGVRRFGCTGTLIASNAVLTAAHCLDLELMGKGKMVNVLFDNTYTTAANREARKITKAKSHPLYNSLLRKFKALNRGVPPKVTLDHDIAVLFFEGTAPASFAPAVLETDTKRDYSGATAYVFGYGRAKNYANNGTESLLYSVGDLRLGKIPLDDSYSADQIRYFSTLQSDQKVCQGDSGGPQFIVDGRGARIIGVNSAGGAQVYGGLDCSYGKSQATKVAYFAPWISQQLKGAK